MKPTTARCGKCGRKLRRSRWQAIQKACNDCSTRTPAYDPHVLWWRLSRHEEWQPIFNGAYRDECVRYAIEGRNAANATNAAHFVNEEFLVLRADAPDPNLTVEIDDPDEQDLLEFGVKRNGHRRK